MVSRDQSLEDGAAGGTEPRDLRLGEFRAHRARAGQFEQLLRRDGDVRRRSGDRQRLQNQIRHHVERYDPRAAEHDRSGAVSQELE